MPYPLPKNADSRANALGRKLTDDETVWIALVNAVQTWLLVHDGLAPIGTKGELMSAIINGQIPLPRRGSRTTALYILLRPGERIRIATGSGSTPRSRQIIVAYELNPDLFDPRKIAESLELRLIGG